LWYLRIRKKLQEIRFTESNEKVIMLLIHEKDEHILNFFTPIIIIFMCLLLAAFLSLPIEYLLLNQSFIPTSEGDPVLNLIILSLRNFISVFIIWKWIIPFFKISDTEYLPTDSRKTFKTIIIATLAYTLTTISTIIMLGLFNLFKLDEPETSYGQLVFTEHHINPINIILLFVAVSIAAPLFEELVFRRILIPLLEDRGVSPFSAAIISALAFSLTHVPNDLLYGNLTNAVRHFLAVFILGIIFGVSYVYTRNVIYPILIHGIVNGVSFLPSIAKHNDTILVLWAITILLVLFIGLISWIYVIRKFFKHPNAEFVRIIKKRSLINIFPGLWGLLIIFLGLILGKFMLENLLNNLVNNGLILLVLSITSYFVFFLVLWLIVRKTEYISS
jgi:membrane protease YdiL (CAAX protease family)